MSLLSVRREVGEFRKRYRWMALFVVSVFSVLLGRMMQLQVIEHEHFAEIAHENITKTIPLHATRGIVRDRAGRVVISNRASWDVYITPMLLEEGHVPLIEELLGLSEAERIDFEERLAAIPERRRSHQIPFFIDVSRESLAALETHAADLSDENGRTAVDVVATPVRTYPFHALAAHAIGYLNEISAEELAELRPAGYRRGELVGRSGIERAWENLLRGRRGYRRVPVDAQNHILEDEALDEDDDEPSLVDPVPGRDVTLTLDMELMRIVERAFRGHPSGGAVVVDVRTGAIRALFSKPSYDLEAWSSGLSRSDYASLRDDPFRPLTDKTLYESYFPASTFKPFSALAALEEGILDAHTRVNCTGSYVFGRGRPPRCTGVHGEVDLRSALVQSCNVYFYRLAELTGIDRISRMAQDFGLGRRSGIGINAEAAGFVPTREWYERRNAWQGGIALNVAIGQGDTRVTLVQLAMAYAAIANGGTLYVPQLVERVSGPDGTTVEEFEPRVRRRVHVDPANLERIVDGLYGVVNDASGTAFAARIDDGIAIAGKTGTAQLTGRIRSESDVERDEYHRRAHAWFAGFAPVEDPELAIVVLIEHGGPGGRYAAPVAIQILEEYLGTREAADAAAARH
jgi:penicillin-binding protein 2